MCLFPSQRGLPRAPPSDHNTHTHTEFCDSDTGTGVLTPTELTLHIIVVEQPSSEQCLLALRTTICRMHQWPALPGDISPPRSDITVCLTCVFLGSSKPSYHFPAALPLAVLMMSFSLLFYFKVGSLCRLKPVHCVPLICVGSSWASWGS